MWTHDERNNVKLIKKNQEWSKVSMSIPKESEREKNQAENRKGEYFFKYSNKRDNWTRWSNLRRNMIIQW